MSDVDLPRSPRPAVDWRPVSSRERQLRLGFSLRVETRSHPATPVAGEEEEDQQKRKAHLESFTRLFGQSRNHRESTLLTHDSLGVHRPCARSCIRCPVTVFFFSAPHSTPSSLYKFSKLLNRLQLNNRRCRGRLKVLHLNIFSECPSEFECLISWSKKSFDLLKYISLKDGRPRSIGRRRVTGNWPWQTAKLVIKMLHSDVAVSRCFKHPPQFSHL